MWRHNDWRAQDEGELMKQAREKEEDMVKRTLMALNDMKIKFPGKSEEEAEYILDKVSLFSPLN